MSCRADDHWLTIVPRLQMIGITNLRIRRRRKNAELTDPGVDVMITIFCDFRQFSMKKLAFFSKTNVMIIFKKKLSFVLSQKRQYFR
jgi:hypothetical protein